MPRGIYRSGLARLDLPTGGEPEGRRAARCPAEFHKWHQKTLIGVSLKVIAPTGQYDQTKLINWGENRWAFQPELGYSGVGAKSLLDAYGGVWFYTLNPNFFDHNNFVPGRKRPVGEPDWRLRRSPELRLEDAHLGIAGRQLLVRRDLQLERRRHIRQPAKPVRASDSPDRSSWTNTKTIKFSYSDGAYIRVGGNYQSVSVAWQWSWIGRPK